MTGTQVSGLRSSPKVVKMFCWALDDAEAFCFVLNEFRKFWTMAEGSSAGADPAALPHIQLASSLGMAEINSRAAFDHAQVAASVGLELNCTTVIALT
jgi:hypothetical protein